jgi:uncharacterized membrane protein (DUF4010 family)
MPALLTSIIVSVCLGALVGLIRQWSDQREAGGEVDFGGVRTFSLWALLGCVATHLTEEFSAAVLPVVLLMVGAYLTAMALRDPGPRRPGNTTFAAALLTCLAGALVARGQTQPAIVVAALTMVMLGIKGQVHAWTRGFTADDIRATLQFAAITGVILPLVPNRTYGPYDAFNPYATWLMVVLISGLSFAGYIAMRLLGERAGIFMTSVLGGLASSTASTLAFSRQSKEDQASAPTYSFAVVTACTVMLPRVVVMVGVVSPALAWQLAVPFALMIVPAFGYGLWLLKHRPTAGAGLPSHGIANPLRLTTAIKFALLYAAIAFLVRAAANLEWQGGMLPLAFLSGLTDMDAIALSMAGSHAGGSVALRLAAQAIVLGAVANSLLKAGLAYSLGAPLLKRHATAVLGLTALAGVAWLLLG